MTQKVIQPYFPLALAREEGEAGSVYELLNSKKMPPSVVWSRPLLANSSNLREGGALTTTGKRVDIFIAQGQRAAENICIDLWQNTQIPPVASAPSTRRVNNAKRNQQFVVRQQRRERPSWP